MSRESRLFGGAVVVGLVAASSAAGADSTLTFDGTLTDAGDEHVLIDFEVPAGTQEIQIDHDDLSADDILDWGLWSPDGFRGWGGGNTEPLVVGELASSRSYLIGPITPGTWHFDIGKAKLVDGSADYAITVTLRDAPTLPPQTERTPLAVPGPTLSDATAWYAGDFHVHSEQSGDASATFQQITDLARQRGLDFVELSDHNTTAQLDYYKSIQDGVTDLLFMPGVEFTTYHGHANGIGATAFVDFRMGLPDVDIHAAATAYHAQGALFSINHPAFDLGDACIGCAFQYVDEMEPGELDGIEVATAASAQIFYDQTSKIWESLADRGHRLAALGGSDDHSAGENIGAFGAPIGSPTTMVYAAGLSAEAIKDGIREARTVVKVRGPDDPMAEVSIDGDDVVARITGGGGLEGQWVVDGVIGDRFSIDADPFESRVSVVPLPDKARRARLEILEGASPVTLTSHVWIEAGDGGAGGAGGSASTSGISPEGGGADGCAAANDVDDVRGGGVTALLVAAAAVSTRLRRRRNKTKRSGRPAREETAE